MKDFYECKQWWKNRYSIANTQCGANEQTNPTRVRKLFHFCSSPLFLCVKAINFTLIVIFPFPFFVHPFSLLFISIIDLVFRMNQKIFWILVAMWCVWTSTKKYFRPFFYSVGKSSIFWLSNIEAKHIKNY